MRKVDKVILVLCAVFLATCSSGDKIAYNPETAVLLHNATVFDTKSGTMIPSQDILIDGEKIIAVKQGKGKAEAVESIDCGGKYVIPGLCDSHTHLAFLTTLGEDTVRTELADFVRRGVLYVRDVGGPIDVMSDLKDKITSCELAGPVIFYTGPMLESSPLNWAEFNKALPGFTVALDTRDDVDRVLPELARKGARFAKTFNNIKPELYPYILEVAGENGLKIVHDPGGMLFNWIPIDAAVKQGITTIEHAKAPWPYVLKDEHRQKHDTLIGPDVDPQTQMPFKLQMASLGVDSVSEERLEDMSSLMIENNVVLCPTLRVFKGWEEEDRAAEEKGEITESQKMRMKIAPGMKAVSEHFVRTLSARGVKLLVGQDSLEAVGTLEEMILMQEAGVSAVEVLKGATIHAAEWLEVDDRYGAVESGKIADLVILNSDPLDDVAHVGDIFMVIQHGEIVKR
jgi:hypothetical protein